MVYLGVEEGCKAHRVFDPRHGKLQISRDVMFQENCEWTWNAGANKDENLSEFMVVDAFDTDEVIVTADVEAGAEHVTPPATAVVPMPRASSPSTTPSNTHAVTSPPITNTPESHEGPTHFRFIVNIYANTEEVVGVDEEENEVMMVMSEGPTYYQEAAIKAYCLEELGFKKCTQEHAVYTSGEGEASILVGVYVDDLIVAGSITEEINKFKQQMMTEFEMSNLGLLSYYLGIEVEQQKNQILLRQSTYAKKILSRFKMEDCNAQSIQWNPRHSCIKTWKGLQLTPRRTQEIGIFGYSDSDLASDLDGRKSTSGMTFYFNESLVSWNSHKHKTLRSLASELTGVEPKSVTLFVDNKSAIALMKNPIFHGHSKHIDTRFHFIRECIEKGQIVIEFVNTDEQRADVLTKALPEVKLAAMQQLLGVRDLEPCQE
ncbi:hypothetical protein ZIOFF_059688 [Zingiber officinale]|uniref:Reverse transcriptase Ty1/copia-type domain-containing protein n=1 Tax=Zingiber officinale TaxID=94328 RepID=A0A8J5KMW3_ZINOF|nr:hypothetical protein ZIOFF_059688 [Zingiber officinale]